MDQPERALKRHVKQHNSVYFDDCFQCWRDHSICRKKIQFRTWREAQEWVDEIHESHQYERPFWQVRYRCVWCDLYHTTSKLSRDALKRMEKARRKWLVEGSGKKGHN